MFKSEDVLTFFSLLCIFYLKIAIIIKLLTVLFLNVLTINRTRVNVMRRFKYMYIVLLNLKWAQN